MVRVFTHGMMGHQIDPSLPIELFLIPASAPHLVNKGHGMRHIKEPLLLIGKSSPCYSSRFPLLLSEWFFTICPTPYNCKENVLRALLNKIFPSFLCFRVKLLSQLT